jgi:hypothetical protein
VLAIAWYIRVLPLFSETKVLHRIRHGNLVDVDSSTGSRTSVGERASRLNFPASMIFAYYLDTDAFLCPIVALLQFTSISFLIYIYFFRRFRF